MRIGRIEIKDYKLKIYLKKIKVICPWCRSEFKTYNVEEFNGYCGMDCLGSSREKKKQQPIPKKIIDAYQSYSASSCFPIGFRETTFRKEDEEEE